MNNMYKLTISPNFTVEDIRKIRDYNGERHMGKSSDEIMKDTKNNVKEFRKYLEERKLQKV